MKRSEEVLTILAKLWADQYGQEVKDIKIWRANDKEVNNDSSGVVANVS